MNLSKLIKGLKVADSASNKGIMNYIDLEAFRDDFNLTSSVIIKEFDAWASTDMLNEFMQHMSDVFDIPESLDYTVFDYTKNSGLSLDTVLGELNAWLSSDQANEFINDCAVDFDLV